ncbi:MAG: MgtC/SapB family protein [Chloroflexota bacterium]|jgi:putative Mg2+ transporter-C (MgtC) family protein
MISDTDILIRVLVATALGAVIGFERERQNQPAGWRTHIVLVVGACLAMSLSINLSIQFQPLLPSGDPARLAAQVISGIGFLGAGAILRYGPNVKGLTTAASLWTMAVVGLVVGAGYFVTAAATTLLLLVVLEVLDRAEKKMFGPDLPVTVELRLRDRPGALEDLKKTWEAYRLKAKIVSLRKNMINQRLEVELTFRSRKTDLYELLSEEMASFEGLESFKIS